MSEQALTEAEVYDSTRLPYYGDIDYDQGAERVALGEEAIAAYVEACEKWLATADADGWLDDHTRADYAVGLDVTMEVVATGEAYERDDFTACPGDLYWRGCPEAVERCRR